MPPELQQRVYEEVEQTKRRSGWPARRTLAALGIARRSYYRWLQEEAWAKALPGVAARPLQPYEALPEERAKVREYALKHPDIRHRELAWRMVDEDVAYLSPSTVYRILREAKLVCPWRRRARRRREADEKAERPDEIWAKEGQLQEKPAIRSDNGSGYISREFGGVLDEHGLSHRKIKPHCPEENGVMERANRTIEEALEGEDLDNYLEGVKVIDKVVRWYNEVRLHSALGFLRPLDYYRGNPDELHQIRRRKMAQARHRRRERNLQLRQPTLPFTS